MVELDISTIYHLIDQTKVLTRIVHRQGATLANPLLSHSHKISLLIGEND